MARTMVLLLAAPRGEATLVRALFGSSLFRQLVVPHARATMVRTAEANGIPWRECLAWLRGARAWDDGALARVQRDGVDVPEYYRAPFHAYEQGNLCWEAALEQELAGKAVGVRNFPRAPDPEEAFRASFDAALDSLGAACPDGGAIVDLGCGTGTSTRRLAARFPRAATVVGLDVSPHMLAVGRALLELAPRATGDGEHSAGDGVGAWVSAVAHDARVSLEHAEISATRLGACSCDVAVLSLVLHELPPAAARAVFREAARVLRPGGQLWVGEMDFETDGYRKLRANALLYSLIRSTEPYLDEYAMYQSAGMVDDLFDAGFGVVRLAAATGRHFALVASMPAADAAPVGGRVLDDRRRETAMADTHLPTWQAAARKGSD
ncbi:hypothetical protein KFE25_004977 [Diacronema lutheri]|uniref:Methyltransferase type 11 domain-containing protein n=2 Tax=Diacronema lutheri TaxID=2081491 RepID=A0A8J5X8B6_DIALT|nr:hypothetical protein KFE25_004977 [Diacronema lutheri]